MGQRLLAGLNGLRDLPIVGDVRGIGLLTSLELVKDVRTRERLPVEIQAGQQLMDLASEHGLLVRCPPGGGDVILAPPLTVDAAQIDQALSILRKCLVILQQRVLAG
jgi:adenosylmethionine-8-amino-7-oxononanoate aminotransferase